MQSPGLSVLNKQSTRTSLAWFNWSLMLRGVFDTICGGTTFIFVAFALAVGIQGESVARFTLAASVGCIFQMLILPMVRRMADRKRFVIRAGLIEPLVLVDMVLSVPLVPVAWRLYLMVGAVFVAASFLNMTRPITDDWIASTIPGGIRGRYLGRRFQLFSVSMLLVAIPVGIMGDVVTDSAWGLAAILAIGGLFGMLAVAALARAPMANVSPMSINLPDIPRVFAQRPFKRFILGNVIFNLPFFIAVPFYHVYYLTVLEMSKLSIALVIVVYHVTKIASCNVIGRTVDRFGPRRIALLSGPAYVLFFLILISGQPGAWWPVLLAWALAAVADAAYSVASQTALFGTVPPQGARPAYFAVSNLLLMTAFAIGAILGEWWLRSLVDVHWSFGGIALGQYRIFYTSMALFMVPCIFGALLFLPTARQPRTSASANGTALRN